MPGIEEFGPSVSPAPDLIYIQGVQMIFGPRSGNLDDNEVAGAYPWPDGPWVRSMMVTTLDGAYRGPDGLSDSISSSVDKAVFDAVRRFADAVLVGAGTIRAERYGAMRVRPADLAARAAARQAPAPVVAVVSGSLDLPWDTGLFTGSSLRPIVFTGPDPDPAARAEAEAHAEVVCCPADLAVDGRPPASFLIDTLIGRGLRRIVCEGGPHLLEELVAADLLDEADLTLSPVFAGLSHAAGTGLKEVARFELVHLLEAEGFLMGRYVAPGRGRSES